MHRTLFLSLFALVFTASLLRAAEEGPKFPAPVKEHEWLKQFVGEWETESNSVPMEGQPQMHCKGKMSARMLGGFWMVSESSADMMGQKMIAVQTIGYDAAKKKYLGTWVDSMMNHMWTYEGEVDAAGKKITLEAEGPNFMQEGKTAKFRDAYEFKSADEIAVSSSMLGDDGKWVVFMNGTAKRKK